MEVSWNRPSFELLAELIIKVTLNPCITPFWHLFDTIKNPEDSPAWLSDGITYLLPKTNDTVNPKNYKPITCPSTNYKLLSSVITERMYVFMKTIDLFPIEQKGCKRGSYGWKDQLLINRMIIKDCKSKHRNLRVVWIDYRKPFGSVPHSWILKVLDKISPVIINFLRINMSIWETTLDLTH